MSTDLPHEIPTVSGLDQDLVAGTLGYAPASRSWADRPRRHNFPENQVTKFHAVQTVNANWDKSYQNVVRWVYDLLNDSAAESLIINSVQLPLFSRRAPRPGASMARGPVGHCTSGRPLNPPLVKAGHVHLCWVAGNTVWSYMASDVL